MEDTFKIGSTVSKENDILNNYVIIDNSEFPFFTLKNDITKAVEYEVYINKLRLSHIPSSSGIEMESWDHMFDSPGSTVKDKIIKVKKPCLDIVKNEYLIEGISKDFVKKLEKFGGGLTSPFDEIKKYDAWLWGSDPSRPGICYRKKQEENKVCTNCVNLVYVLLTEMVEVLK